jgi:putative transposase
LEISKGKSNIKAAAATGLTQEQSKRWRDQWLPYKEAFTAIENMGCEDIEKNMTKKIMECIADAPCSGAACTFSAEQYCQIMGIALEPPGNSGRPINKWTARETADDAIKRGIVTSISSTQVGVILKGERNKAAQNGGVVESSL